MGATKYLRQYSMIIGNHAPTNLQLLSFKSHCIGLSCNSNSGKIKQPYVLLPKGGGRFHLPQIPINKLLLD